MDFLIGLVAFTSLILVSILLLQELRKMAKVTANFSIHVEPGLVLGGSLPAGAVAQPYSAAVAASGGTPPYSYSIESGSLPAGLSLAADGSISGTPTEAGDSSFVIAVTDSQG